LVYIILSFRSAPGSSTFNRGQKEKLGFLQHLAIKGTETLLQTLRNMVLRHGKTEFLGPPRFITALPRSSVLLLSMDIDGIKFSLGKSGRNVSRFVSFFYIGIYGQCNRVRDIMV
jgi:hypothetical protein